MKISGVVVTANRSNLLTKCLTSLLASANDISTKFIELEFNVICNGQDVQSKKVAYEVLNEKQLKFFQIEKPLFPGAARNLALENVTGDWIFFADDDIYVEKDFFSQFEDLVMKRPEYSVIGGPNLTPPDSTSFQELSGQALASPFASFYCSQRYKISQESTDVDDTALTLCNLFVKTKALGDIRFSNSLLCAEENFVLAFLEKKGCRFLASPGLKVYHERRDTLSGFARQLLKYGHGRGQLILRGEAQWFHFVPLVCVILFLIFPIFSVTKIFLIPMVALYFVGVLRAAGVIVLNSNNSFKEIPFLSFLIMTIHVHYAIGMSRGMVFELFSKVDNLRN